MRNIKEILRLKWTCGLTHRQIARALGVSVGAVSVYASQAAVAGLDWAAIESLDETALAQRLSSVTPAPTSDRAMPDYLAIHQELRRKGVTLNVLWEEYVAGHVGEPTYCYSQFCHRYRAWAATLKRSMRQTHRAGEKLFADFAGSTVPIYAREGGVAFQAHVFVAVLGASNYTYACAQRDETMASWIGGLVQALEYIGGVPALLVPDNPKALIAQPDRYEPVLGRTTQEFVSHYGTAMLPARPRKPQDKAKVEVAVQIVERWILARLRHHRFFSLGALNKAMSKLLTDLNQRPLKKLGGTRREWFERLDQPELRSLPGRRYEVATFRVCRVNIDYHVEVDGHYYSVPHRLVRQEVEVRLTRHAVEILHGGKRVAAHVRQDRRGAHSTVADHMPAAHRAHLEWSPGRLLRWASSIGPGAAVLVEHLLTNKPHPEMGYRACLGLLGLARTYDKTRLEAACARAVHVGALSRRSVKSILEAGLDRQPLPTTDTTWHPPEHENVRGPNYYH
jgi:transposase